MLYPNSLFQILTPHQVPRTYYFPIHRPPPPPARPLLSHAMIRQENGSADVNVQLWKFAQSRLALHSKSGGDAMDRGAIQIGDLPATAFTHDDMEDQVASHSMFYCFCFSFHQLSYVSYDMRTYLFFVIIRRNMEDRKVLRSWSCVKVCGGGEEREKKARAVSTLCRANCRLEGMCNYFIYI